jgi:drug/metabolite transporter (DMT)-like permease
MLNLRPRPNGLRSQPIVQATAGAACISASGVLIALANVAPTTTTFYRCVLPLPVLAVLAVAEQRRLDKRSPARRGYAVLAGLFFAINFVLWVHSIADVGAGAATVLGSIRVPEWRTGWGPVRPTRVSC